MPAQIVKLTGLTPPWPDSLEWYGSMIALPIPKAPDTPPAGVLRDPMQNVFWERHRMEVPIMHWRGHRFLRVSCHLYNTRSDIDRLVEALEECLAEERGQLTEE